MRSRHFATVSVLATALVVGACSAPQAQQQGGPPPPQVDVAVPLSSQVADWNGYTGRVESVEPVDVRARVSGYVK